MFRYLPMFVTSDVSLMMVMLRSASALEGIPNSQVSSWAIHATAVIVYLI